MLMGILNISPESFYSGSFIPSSQIQVAAEQMIQKGAEILDIGARSTAPGSVPISVSEEKKRIKESLTVLDGNNYCMSIDTMHPEVLNTALQYGVSMLNDISGLLNQEMASLVADSGIPVILMASRKEPGDATNFDETIQGIQQVLSRADQYGIENIILDPGIGRWIPERATEADWELCRRFSELKQFGYPLLAAVSRKTFIGDITQQIPKGRLAGTLAVTAKLIEEGAAVIRAHDVPETMDVIKTISHLQEFS